MNEYEEKALRDANEIFKIIGMTLETSYPYGEPSYKVVDCTGKTALATGNEYVLVAYAQGFKRGFTEAKNKYA